MAWTRSRLEGRKKNAQSRPKATSTSANFATAETQVFRALKDRATIATAAAYDSSLAEAGATRATSGFPESG